jgi:DNA-binding MarR family transcriptional regulator
VRERSTPDRRQVLCQITPAGMAVLALLDRPVDEVNAVALGVLDEAALLALIQTLGTVRAGYAARVPASAQRSSRAGQPPR